MPVPPTPIHHTVHSSFLFSITFHGLNFYFYLYSTQHSKAARMNVFLGLLWFELIRIPNFYKAKTIGGRSQTQFSFCVYYFWLYASLSENTGIQVLNFSFIVRFALIFFLKISHCDFNVNVKWLVILIFKTRQKAGWCTTYHDACSFIKIN